MSVLDIFRDATEFEFFPQGKNVFREGEPGSVMFVVKEGAVEIRVKNELLETIGPGSIFGEMALVDSRPRSATAVCKTSCKLVPIDEKTFRFLIKQTPDFALQVMTILANRIRGLDERVLEAEKK
jgi:CRP/FNR family transcriptional regulator, cyclic AMP receptor protein